MPSYSRLRSALSEHVVGICRYRCPRIKQGSECTVRVLAVLAVFAFQNLFEARDGIGLARRIACSGRRDVGDVAAWTAVVEVVSLVDD